MHLSFFLKNYISLCCLGYWDRTIKDKLIWRYPLFYTPPLPLPRQNYESGREQLF